MGATHRNFSLGRLYNCVKHLGSEKPFFAENSYFLCFFQGKTLVLGEFALQTAENTLRGIMMADAIAEVVVMVDAVKLELQIIIPNIPVFHFQSERIVMGMGIILFTGGMRMPFSKNRRMMLFLKNFGNDPFFKSP